MAAAEPRVHTLMPEDEPEHHGEFVFASELVKLCGDDAHLWFSVDYLPGVSDLDLLLCVEPIGFFAIEIKAFPVDAIEELTATHMAVKRRSGRKHPLKQARRAQLKLVEFLKAVRVSPPFIYTTAAFPKISRSEFVDRFGGANAVRLQAEGMLFAEDLSDRQSLEARLTEIRKNPPFGAAPQNVRAPSPSEISAIVAAIDPDGRPRATPADVERSAVLRQPVRRGSGRSARVADYLDPGNRPPTVFRGYPGTGKTFFLLRIALEHARAGRSVLFLCFNRVLASDIKRMLATTNLPKEIVARIDVTHAWSFRGRYAGDYVNGDDGVMDELPGIFAAQSPLEEYGTVCVDEAQDLPEWAFQLAQWHLADVAEWFLAHGPGQELYSATPAPFMAAVLERARAAKSTVQLNRVYRTAHIDFLVAQGVYEQAPDVSKIATWVSERPLPAAPEGQPGPAEQDGLFDAPLAAEFETAGSLPAIVEVPKWTEERAPSDLALRRQSIRDVLKDELAKAAAEGRPGDVAVLLRHVRRKDDANDVRAALGELGVPFIDQVDQSNRDLLLPAGHVRLVSFKSARGVEAHRTVLIGFDDLVDGDRAVLRDGRNQAYIALSRSKAGTTVITRPHRRGDFSVYLAGLVDAYARSRPHIDMTARKRVPPRSEIEALSWAEGTVDRVKTDGGFGFIRDAEGEDTFFHMSALVGLDLEDAVGRPVWFTAIMADRGRQATVVVSSLSAGSNLDPQPGYEAGFITMPIGDRGFGFLVVPGSATRVLFHVNHVADGSPELNTGDRVDVLVDRADPHKPRGTLVAPR